MVKTGRPAQRETGRLNHLFAHLMFLRQKPSTLPKTNIDPDNGPLEECFPLPTSGFQGPC